MSLVESLAGSLAGPLAGKLARQIGLPESMVKAGVAAAVPLLVGALAKNARGPEGRQSLANAIDRDHQGAVVDDLDGYVERGGNVDDGDGILRHTLGDRRGAAEQALAKGAGIDLGAASKLLPMLAPLVMGAIGKQKQEQGLDADGVADLLRAEQTNAVQKDAGGVGGMAALLDRDGDGDMMDDVGDLAGLASRFLGR